MKTVVAFTGNRVQILCGEGSAAKIELTRIIDVEFDMNCVLSGVVTDPDVFCAGVKRAWEQNALPKSGIILSLDGNNIKSKKIKIPKVNDKKTLEIVAGEFKEIEILTDPLFSYATVAENPADREILALGSESEFVVNLERLFASIGIKVAAITSTRCTIIKLLGFLDIAPDRSCIIQAMDEENLTTVLIDSGRFMNISSSRIFSEHGSPSFGAEVARNVSQLRQFQQSEKSANIATEVLMAGFRKEDFDVAKEQTEAMGLTATLFAEGQRLQFCEPMNGRIFLHAGAFALGKREANLFAAYQAKLQNSKGRDKLLIKILPILLLVAVLTAISSSLVIANMSKENEVKSLTDYIQSPENIQAQADYNAKVTESATLNRRFQAAEEIKTAIESYPLATSALNETITAAGSGNVTVSITSFTASTGSLNFTAEGKNAETVNEFIKALTDTGLFYYVTYSGYNQNAEDTGYNINVSCVLSPNAGRE